MNKYNQPTKPHKKASITQREKQILKMRDRGDTAKEVARELHISPDTVNKTQVRVAEKYGLPTARLQVVLSAVRCSLGQVVIAAMLSAGMPHFDDRHGNPTSPRRGSRSARIVRCARSLSSIYQGVAI